MALTIPLLWTLLTANLEAFLVVATLGGAAAIPIYILSHVFKLAALPRETRGWNPPPSTPA
jgi:hypothetical protein